MLLSPHDPALIALGSNVGDRAALLDRAVESLGRHPRVQILAVSRWHETPPVGGPSGQSPFLNGAVLIETSLAPDALLALLQQIEGDLGRQRHERWGPRTMDLDLLLYGQLVLDTPSLVVPHPRMAWRRFMLRPAAEVAGSMVHPTTGWTIERLLEHLEHAVPYVAITGSIGAGKTLLAERLARQGAAEWISEPLDASRLAAFYADPPSHAWQMEIEFLQQRARLLDADSREWSGRKSLAVTDFWFDQSLAFARVWLTAEPWEAFRLQWQQRRQRVVRPKLIVVLDAPAERLLERVRRRGRPYERNLSVAQIERIRQAILDQAGQPDQGPVLRIAADDPDRVFEEARAAVEAMA